MRVVRRTPRMSDRRVAAARSILIAVCLATLTPSLAQALDFRGDPLGSSRALRPSHFSSTPRAPERLDLGLSAHWKRQMTSGALGDAIGTVLDTPRLDSNFIENPEPNAGVLLGLGLLGLTARRYRSA